MKNVKKIISIALITILTTSLIGCNMIEKTPEGVAKSVVAKVFDAKVTRGELDKELAMGIPQIKAQYGENYASNTEAVKAIAEQKTLILDNLIAGKIMNYKAKELGVMPTDAKMKTEIDKQLEEIKKSLESEAKYKEELKNANITEAELKERIKPNVIQTALYTEVTKAVKVTEAQEKVYYTANPVMFTEKPNRVQVARIVVATPEEGAAIKKLLDAGGDFAVLAKEKSLDTASKEAGGDLGFIEYNSNQYDPILLKAAIATEKGKVSEPITTQEGVQLIKVLEKEEFPVKKFETVKEEINKIVLTQEKEKKWTEAITKWKEEGKIKKYEKNL